MSTNKEEYKQLQGKIIRHLFDTAKAAKFTDLAELIKKPESEAKYHCEVLTEQGLIEWKSVSVSDKRSVDGYIITPLGRKLVMES